MLVRGGGGIGMGRLPGNMRISLKSKDFSGFLKIAAP